MVKITTHCNVKFYVLIKLFCTVTVSNSYMFWYVCVMCIGHFYLCKNSSIHSLQEAYFSDVQDRRLREYFNIFLKVIIFNF